MAKVPTHKQSSKGFSAQMADAINRQQAAKAQRKMGNKMHPSKPKQGYTPQRSGVDISTL